LNINQNLPRTHRLIGTRRPKGRIWRKPASAAGMCRHRAGAEHFRGTAPPALLALRFDHRFVCRLISRLPPSLPLSGSSRLPKATGVHTPGYHGLKINKQSAQQRTHPPRLKAVAHTSRATASAREEGREKGEPDPIPIPIPSRRVTSPPSSCPVTSKTLAGSRG
jgi:hypothetical protein